MPKSTSLLFVLLAVAGCDRAPEQAKTEPKPATPTPLSGIAPVASTQAGGLDGVRPLAKGGIPDDSIRPLVPNPKGGVPDDSVKPLVPNPKGGVPDDSVRPLVPNPKGGVPDDSVRPLAPSPRKAPAPAKP